MGRNGAAAGIVGLWVLATMGVAADPDVTEPQRCLLSHYRSLDPRELLAVKALRDHYVSDAQRPPPLRPWHRQAQRCQSVQRGPGELESSRCMADLRVQNCEP